MKPRTNLIRGAAAIAVLSACQSSLAVVSSNGGANPPYSGINLNDFLGADRFYNSAYTGSRAILTNIEAGHIWNEHETLTHVSTFIDDPGSPPPNGDFDRHATAVGFTLGGRLGGGNQGEWQRGIAHGVELWSGAIATSWNGPPYSTDFSGTVNSFRYPYYTAMVSGVGSRATDVVNSSWGSGIRDNRYLFGRKLDAMVNLTGKTVVFIAGNAGESANPRVTTPGANFNNITAAALGNDTSNPPYGVHAAFSSFGPNDFWNPATQSVVPGVLAAVDLAAPGTNITSAYYGGTTGGNAGGTFEPGSNLYGANRSGTTFSSPFIAGGAALVVDLGKDRFGGGTSIDGRVVKSVLLNSAHKTAGWNNGQSDVGGVITTTQSLDYRVGAGRMDLSQAYSQYTLGTNDAPGSGGTIVHPIGWDFGQVAEGAPRDFLFNAPLAGGTTLTATLNWFLDNSYVYATDTLIDQSLDNLDLEVWKTSGGVPDVLVAQASSIYNNVEHLNVTLPQTGDYLLRVKWTGEVFDTVNDANQEHFGLAWAAVPVPVQWNVDADGDWSGGGNWSGLVPDVPGARADFGPAIAQPRTVMVDAPKTAGHIAFDNVNGYTIAGPSVITIQTFGGASTISVATGAHTIAAPVDLRSSTTLDVAPNQKLTISGPISAAAYGITLTKTGGGLAELSRVRADALAVNAGELRVLPDGSAAATSVLRSLLIAQSTVPGVSAARLDLTDNAMVIDYAHGTPSPQLAIKDLIREGYNSGAWDGNGIATSMGNTGQFALGYGEASALASVPAIFGLLEDDSAVLVRFTRYGDANLDALVNLDDFNRLAANFGSSGAAWTQGDFNYDCLVNLDDFNRLAANFGLSSAPGGPTPEDWSALASAVPEPACSGAPAALIAIGMMARHRRRSAVLRGAPRAARHL